MKTTLKQQMNAIKNRKEVIDAQIAQHHKNYPSAPSNSPIVKLIKKLQKVSAKLNDAYSTIAAMNLLVQHPESIQAGIASAIRKRCNTDPSSDSDDLATCIVKYLCDRGLPFGKVN